VRLFVGTDGLSWRSPSHVLATISCVCSERVCVCECVCTALSVFIAVHFDNNVIFYPLSPLTVQNTENSSNATPEILNSSVQDTVLIREVNLGNVTKAGV